MANYTVETAKTPMTYLLYRGWADELLLYIGITTSPQGRFKFHRKCTPGWRWVTCVTREDIGLIDRDAARLVESQAIRDERPLLNTMGNACLLSNCEAPAAADLMCRHHYATRRIPHPWSLNVLLDIRSGASVPALREVPRRSPAAVKAISV